MSFWILPYSVTFCPYRVIVIEAGDTWSPCSHIQDTPILFRMAPDPIFQGWLGLDKDSAQGKMVWKSFEPKPFDETDVDIKITHCGICGSDLHVSTPPTV